MPTSVVDRWLSNRALSMQASGIRKIFELARTIPNPVNLSIGQPDFDVPDAVKAAAHTAIDKGYNGYTMTYGLPELRNKIRDDLLKKHTHPDRDVIITSGTSGAIFLALSCVVNPGDEVILFDPYFALYNNLITLVGGVTVPIDTYPDFDIDVDRVRAAITPRTKVILVNSPSNPTGRIYTRERMRDLALLAAKHGILLISDEIYRVFDFDGRFASPLDFNEDAIIIDGFSKSHGMTGWRLGFAHGPRRLIDEMIKLQTYTFVCPTSVVQHAGLVAWDCDVSDFVTSYRAKRDRIWAGLKDHYDLVKPDGAFYAFPKAPHGTGTEFVTEAVKHKLLMIPGVTFSKRDTHFRLSYAADNQTLDRGIEILQKLAR